MAPANKAEKKASIDAAAWMFNVVTSVGIIIVNKALMATYGFSFGNSTLESVSYATIYNDDEIDSEESCATFVNSS